MAHHRTRPRQRKQRRPDARWLITGNATPAILHHNQRAYLQPVRAGDHPKRYAAGQRLAVKPYVPGPTEAHAIVTTAERIALPAITDQIARELGYHDSAEFRLAWVRNHDTDWWLQLQDQHTDENGYHDLETALDKALDRFQHRWPNKTAWLIRFKLDHSESPRMLARGGATRDRYITLADGRQQWVPSDNEAESDRGYTSSDALSLRDEPRALTDDEWHRHIGPNSAFRERERLRAQRQAREGHTIAQRLAGARATAQSKGVSIRDEARLLERLVEQGQMDRAKQQIALIERRVYPAAA